MSNLSEIIDKRLKTGDIIFSICSLVLSVFLFLIIIINKNLRSLTYDFLMFVFLSEIINSIGNIIEYSGKIKLASTLLIPLSDIFTMMLFCFFMYCSCEQLIKSNKNIKNKKKLFIPISAVVGVIYGVILLIVFHTQKQNNSQFYFYNNVCDNSDTDCKNLKFICYIHVGILFLMSVYICYKTFILLRFLKDKQNSDSANSWKIAILVKTLFRFPIICILYWLFFILYTLINLINGEYKIKFLLKLYAKAFLCLRGFLFGINTIQTNKIQILIEKIWEVQIMHNIILKFNICPKKGSKK